MDSYLSGDYIPKDMLQTKLRELVCKVGFILYYREVDTSSLFISLSFLFEGLHKNCLVSEAAYLDSNFVYSISGSGVIYKSILNV